MKYIILLNRMKTVNKILCATALGSMLSMHYAYTKSVADTVENIFSSERILPEQAMQEQIPTVSLYDILHIKIPAHHVNAKEIYIVRNTTINGKKGITYYQADYERDVHASFDIYEGKG